MAQEDLQAARSLLLESHPGAIPEVGDATFEKQLRSGYDAAVAIAREARTYGAYRAALQRFAASFNDPHIGTASLVQVNRYWPGFAVGLQGDRWKVIARVDEQAPPLGATLLSCDGKSPSSLAQERLAPFTGSWTSSAERARASTLLLQDVGNPLQPRLSRCDIAIDAGRSQTHELRWSSISPPEIGRHIAAARPHPSEDVWLRPFHQGFWIRLGTSGGAAVAILAEAERHQTALRAAPFVVLDLRGNAGGASLFTDDLAKRIYGSNAVLEARRPRGKREPEMIVWRASKPSLRTLDNYIHRMSRLFPAEHPGMLGLIAQRDAVSKALASGAPTVRALAEVRLKGSASRPDRVEKPPRVILVTDRHCFSSCILGVRLFRALGAEHVGEETRANTRYSDLRGAELPSGLSNFFTLQSFSTWLPIAIGPYAPTQSFEGNLSDDAAVQAWVRNLVRHSRR